MSHVARWRVIALVAALVGIGFLPTLAQRPPEEEEPGGVKRVVRPNETEPTRKAVAPPIPREIDFAKEAQDSKVHPTFRKLCMDLTVPYDTLTIKTTDVTRTEFVKPLTLFIGGSNERIQGPLHLEALKEKNLSELKKEYDLDDLSMISGMKPYEALAREKIQEFFDRPFDKLPKTHPSYLSELDRLILVEQALMAVARTHDSLIAQGKRRGGDWEKIRNELNNELLTVVLKRLQISIDKENWDEAFALAQQTAGRFPAKEQQNKIADKVGVLVKQALGLKLGQDQFKEVHRRLREFEDQFPNSDATKPVREKLIAMAEPLFNRAAAAREEKKYDEARELLRQAEEIYPNMPGLRGVRLDVEEKYPTMRVGVKELPVNMWPATACTDAETQAIELMFEGLVELGPDGQYRSALAQGRPRMLPLGRQFLLPRNVYWPKTDPNSKDDAKQLTAVDIRNTLQLLRSQDWPSRCPAWGDELVEDVGVTDPFRVNLTLKQGYFEPLALMSFKILPPDMLQKPDMPLKKDALPFGTGPYRYVGRKTDQQRKVQFAQFLANPNFTARPGNTGLPRIHDIQFYETTNMVGDFVSGRIDMVLDVPTDQVSKLKQTPNVSLVGPLRGRRIHFLAVNHRHEQLAKPEVRQALALAVPREELLKSFRADLGGEVHKPLNGPYPVGSWAYSDKVGKADPYDIQAAANLLEKAGAKGLKLSLLCPSDDAQAIAAMEGLQKLWKEKLNVELTLKKLDPRSLREEVEKNPLPDAFQLAYYYHDYADDTFWLYPLLDPRGNYMGYTGGGSLEKFFRTAMAHRNFERVQNAAHTIHRLFWVQEMPFIPLWQLDRFVAFHDDVKLFDGNEPLAGSSLDAQRVFQTVEYWKLDRKK